MRAPNRPLMRYHGGKWRLAPWIIANLPPHDYYVEPFGGAASVLLQKPVASAEVYNDIDGEIVNVFSVLRSASSAGRLADLLHLTPYSRLEWDCSRQSSHDSVERARRSLVRAYMGFCAALTDDKNTGFRRKPFRQNVPATRQWNALPNEIEHFVQRLKNVVIECMPALELIRAHDCPEVLFYLDPPYHPTTRSAVRYPCEEGRVYRHDMPALQHAELLETLSEIEGMAVVSGYRCAEYDEALSGWTRIDKATHADGGRPRVESLWLNPQAVAACHPLDLFSA